VEGFIKPDPDRAAEREPEEIIVSVPDWEGDKGLVKRAMKSMGLENDD
jgi:hypothetical protein